MLYKSKGFLLAELNMALMLIVILSLIFSGGLKQMLSGWQKLQADMMLYRAVRYSLSFPEREVFLNAATVKIIDNGKNSKLVCKEIFGNRQVTFYTSGERLYREIKNNTQKGVNVLSLASVKVLQFTAEQVNSKEILLKIKMQDLKSGRKLAGYKVLLLSNGLVE